MEAEGYVLSGITYGQVYVLYGRIQRSKLPAGVKTK